jgi:hypothetical protein
VECLNKWERLLQATTRAVGAAVWTESPLYSIQKSDERNKAIKDVLKGLTKLSAKLKMERKFIVKMLTLYPSVRLRFLMFWIWFASFPFDFWSLCTGLGVGEATERISEGAMANLSTMSSVVHSIDAAVCIGAVDALSSGRCE